MKHSSYLKHSSYSCDSSVSQNCSWVKRDNYSG